MRGRQKPFYAAGRSKTLPNSRRFDARQHATEKWCGMGEGEPPRPAKSECPLRGELTTEAGRAATSALCQTRFSSDGMNANRKVEDDISTLEAAMLGLLALIIGFTFAMALSRFDTRRDAVLLEANAIGTTALRARLLPEPHRKEVLKLLRDYVRVRLDITQRTPSLADLETAIKQSNDIQEALWREAMAISAIDQNMVPTGLFIQTLNEMIDDQAKRLAALRSRIPNIFYWHFLALQLLFVALRVTRGDWNLDVTPRLFTYWVFLSPS